MLPVGACYALWGWRWGGGWVHQGAAEGVSLGCSHSIVSRSPQPPFLGAFPYFTHQDEAPAGEAKCRPS